MGLCTLSQTMRHFRITESDEDASAMQVPCWTTPLPVTTTLGARVEWERQHPDADRVRDGLAAGREGRRLDEILTETAATYA